MGLLPKFFGSTLQAAGPPAQDDFWYQPVGSQSAAGVTVNPESALGVSTVFRCVSAIAQDTASMPLIVYRRLKDGGKERARNHPLYDLLHDKPNAWQTSFEWRELMLAQVLLRGNAYSLIQPGPRGFADQLIPLNAAYMKVDQLENLQLRYTYTANPGRPKIYSQDEMLHLRGLGGDGIMGYSVVTLAKNSLGLGIATEEHGARFFGQSARPGGVLVSKTRMSDDAKARLKASWDEAYKGVHKSHGTAVLEGDLTWQTMSMSNEDSQFLGTRGFQIEEIARWFGVPLHRIGHTAGVTSWGSGLEQFNLGYVIFTLIPWLRRWEATILRDLVLAPQTFFAEFLVDHLLRGDNTARANYYRTAIVTGWMSRNEVRSLENMNPVEGLDDMLVPQNMAAVDEEGNIVPLNEADKPPVPQRTDTPPPTGLLPGSDPRVQILVQEAAARVVRKEVAAIGKAIRQFEGEPEGFRAWAAEFYRGHARFVAQVLHLDDGQVQAYCGEQLTLVLQGNPNVIYTWDTERVPRLAKLALGDEGKT